MRQESMIKVQLEELKHEVTLNASLYGSAATSPVFQARQQFEETIHEALLSDMDSAVRQGLENELWNCSFKQIISIMQQKTKDKKNPKRGEVQANLTAFLESATGFYLQLLHEVEYISRKNAPGFKKSTALGIFTVDRNPRNRSVRNPTDASCQYVIQYCLIRLGDLARYRNISSQAQIYYEEAVLVGASNGQPYNQLAILFQNKQGKQLCTYFYYLRSMTVKHAFLAASSNLNTTLAKYAQDEECRHLTKKLVTMDDYNKVFCHFNSLIYLMRNRERARDTKDCLIANMRDIFESSEKTNWVTPIRMMFINFFNLWHLTHDGHTITDKLKVSAIFKPAAELSPIEKEFYQLSLDLTIAMFASFLKIITLELKDATVLDFLLPVCKMTLSWMLQNQEVLHLEEVTNRPFIWPLCVKVLNGLAARGVTEFTDSTAPLPEDFEIQGFVPLRQSLEKLALPCHSANIIRGEQATRLRIARMLDIGRAFAEALPSLLTVIEGSEAPEFTTPIVAKSDGDEEKASRERIMAKVLSPTSASKKAKAIGTPTKEASSQESGYLKDPPVTGVSGAPSVNYVGYDSDRSKPLKNVTFEAHPPKTITRTPSPRDQLDLHSERDFPLLGDLRNASGGLNGTQRRENAVSFTSPRLAMSFPGVQNSFSSEPRVSTMQHGAFTESPSFGYPPQSDINGASYQDNSCPDRENTLKQSVFPSVSLKAPPTSFPAFRPEFRTTDMTNYPLSEVMNGPLSGTDRFSSMDSFSMGSQSLVNGEYDVIPLIPEPNGYSNNVRVRPQTDPFGFQATIMQNSFNFLDQNRDIGTRNLLSMQQADKRSNEYLHPSYPLSSGDQGNVTVQAMSSLFPSRVFFDSLLANRNGGVHPERNGAHALPSSRGPSEAPDLTPPAYMQCASSHNSSPDMSSIWAAPGFLPLPSQNTKLAGNVLVHGNMHSGDLAAASGRSDQEMERQRVSRSFPSNGLNRAGPLSQYSSSTFDK